MSSKMFIVLRGYDVRQVDEALAQAEDALSSGSESRRAAAREALRNASFKHSLRGYDCDEVNRSVRELLDRLGG